MVGLLDIAPAVKFVTVRGSEVSVPGISAQGIVSLLSRFPELRRMFTGNEVKPEALMKAGGPMFHAVLAAGCGYVDDEKAEKFAADLDASTQLDLVTAIVEVTMPGGFGPFVEKLLRLKVVAGVPDDDGQPDASPATAPDTRSPSPSSD